MLLALILIASVNANDESTYKDTAAAQIDLFNKTHPVPIGTLTSSNGAPISHETVSNGLKSNLLRNTFFIETASHMVRENIPARVVHDKGAGAFGYFIVTHDVTKFTKANFLSTIGKKTPVAVRFSLGISEKGGIDTSLEPRGIAVKFYTKEGNFDLAGFHTPVFGFKNPNHFSGFVHALKHNPVTNLPRDPNAIWDFLCAVPESLLLFVILFGMRGIPDGYRHMPGFSIHTYQMENKNGESYFTRLYWEPDAGERYLNVKQASELALKDPYYATRDLYNAIENGDFATWTLKMQVLTLEDVKSAQRQNIDVFDVTRILSEKDYPKQEVGKLILNKNPDNYFAQVEQLAFCPSNLVPGFLGAPDKIFEARGFVYRDAQNYRLGVNFNNIQVNRPLESNVLNYNRDGRAPVGSNGGDHPNYYPNSFHGPEAYVNINGAKLLEISQDTQANNFDQTAELYTNGMSEEEKNMTVANIVYSLRKVTRDLQDKAVSIFTFINNELGSRISEGLNIANSTSTG